MTEGPPRSSRGPLADLRAGWASTLALSAVTAAAVAIASQVLLPANVPLGSSLPAPVSSRGLYPAENGFRWTEGGSAIVLPAVGRGRPVEIAVVVSAWRPRGAALPALRIAAGGASAVAQPGAIPAEVVVGPVTSDSWRGDVELRLDSETFAPGRGDPRTLGVRVHALRVRPAGRALTLGAPPLLALLWAVAMVSLAFWIAVAAGSPPRAAFRFGLGAAIVVTAAMIGARFWVARLLPATVSVEAVLLSAILFMPGRFQAGRALVREALGRLGTGGRALLRPMPLAALALLAAAGTTAAYRSRPVLVIPMGSGREAAFEEGLGSFDSAEGVRFRHVATRAVLDLGDLGSGEWRLTVTAAAPGSERALPLADVGTGPIEAPLGPAWSEHVLTAHAPFGWRSGLDLTFPGSRRDDIWVRDVRIDRDRAWPPVRIAAGILAAGLGVALAILAAGVATGPARLAAGAAIALLTLGLAVDPVAAIPAVPRLAVIAAAGALLSAVAAAIAREGLPAAAVAAGGLGFMGWLAATTTSLYRGGHFVFHSSIAEEIWKGRFLLYYLPYPGSMLSQQAQWGNVVVPHPCLYHTLVAPLAALPRPAFFAAEKVLLALLLAAMAWASAALAARLGPPGSAAAAAVLMASMPASYQLLGLGHLMTILGCWAMTMAVSSLALNSHRLHERRWWWQAVMLLALCFLAYFAGLLFMGIVVAITCAALWRRDPTFTRALLGASAAAAGVAFALYYVHWTWPFLSESVPRLLGGSGAQTGANAGALPSRLAAVPHKLAYTFGSTLVPVLGLAGLVLARRGAPRVLLLAWAAILPLFTALDLSFNFLLKHHYFTIAPVAVGGGVLLARLAERGRWGRAMAAAAMILFAFLGARVGLDAATGRIP